MSTKKQAITTTLRRRLLSGQFRPGEVLPTTQELAEEFGAGVYTVHTAIGPLVAEGLLERRRNLGTVVRHNPAVLTCAGIYAGGGLLDDWEDAFYRELCRQIQRQLGDDDVRTTLFADMRPYGDHGEPLPELVRAVEAREIQALFVVMTDNVSSSWLRRLPVTSSYFCSDMALNPVGFQTEELVRLALGSLREQGCRRVGAISSIQATEDCDHPYFCFYEALTSAIADLGLTTRDDWVISPPAHVPNRDRYGYAAFRRLWAQPERPDGLFVYPDNSARGVMTAALELGVDVPDDLKLVFHRNTNVDWHCPLPVRWVESDTAECAAAMIRQIRQQKKGKDIQPVHLPCRLH